MAKRTPRVKHEPKRDPNGKWLPGETGNPFGRPPGPSFLKVLGAYLEANPKKLYDLVVKYVAAGRHGDIRAIADLADRLDGRPTQRTELTGKDGGPLNIIEADAPSERQGGRLSNLGSVPVNGSNGGAE